LRDIAKCLCAPPRFAPPDGIGREPDERPQPLQGFAAFMNILRKDRGACKLRQRGIQLLQRNSAKAFFNWLIDLETVGHTLKRSDQSDEVGEIDIVNSNHTKLS
jgi:hypothetical protein